MIPVDAGARALVFDCDGTLADTMPLHRLAWEELLDRRQLSVPSGLSARLAGMATGEIVELLNRELGVDLEPARVAAEIEQTFLAHLEEIQPIIPVVEIVRAWRDRLPLGVGSGNQRGLVLATLERIRLTAAFSAVVTPEDVAHGKPEPDTFLEVARRLGVEPARCQVFEDGELGLEAARRAGMMVTDVRPYL